MLKRKRYKMIIEDDLHRVTNEVTEYFIAGVRVFQDQRETARRGAEIPAYVRACVQKMDGGECVYCGWVNRPTYIDIMSRIAGGKKRLEPRQFAIDHIIPQVQGGSSLIWNLAYVCRSCNSRKGGRTPLEADMPLQDGRFHKTAIGVLIPCALRNYSADRDIHGSYRKYVEGFGFGEPFNTEFIRIEGLIPYLY